MKFEITILENINQVQNLIHVNNKMIFQHKPEYILWRKGGGEKEEYRKVKCLEK